MAPYYYGMSWECGWFRAIVLSILKFWLAQHPHRHFTLQKFEVHKWATFCTVVHKKTWWRARSREAREKPKPKPKQNGWNAWKSLWYGLYWVQAIVPIFAAHFGNFGLAKFPTGTTNSNQSLRLIYMGQLLCCWPPKTSTVGKFQRNPRKIKTNTNIWGEPWK